MPLFRVTNTFDQFAQLEWSGQGQVLCASVQVPELSVTWFGFLVLARYSAL